VVEAERADAACALRKMKPFGMLTRMSWTSPDTGLVCGASATSMCPGTRNALRRPSIVISMGANTGSSKVLIVPLKSSNGPLPFALPEKMRTSASRCSEDAPSEMYSRSVPPP
jgi:hypothetical protein